MKVKSFSEPVLKTKKPGGKPRQIPLWKLEMMCWDGWLRKKKKKVVCLLCQFWMRRGRRERLKNPPFGVKTEKTKWDDSSPPGFCMQRGLKTGSWDWCKDRGLPR